MIQGRTTKSADSRWTAGCWVGRSELSDEHILLTERGIRMTRTVRRVPESERWDKKLILAALGVPWNPMTGPGPGRPKRLPPAPAPHPLEEPEPVDVRPAGPGPGGAHPGLAPGGAGPGPGPTSTDTGGPADGGSAAAGPADGGSAAAGSSGGAARMEVDSHLHPAAAAERASWREGVESSSPDKKTRISQLSAGPTVDEEPPRVGRRI